MFSPCVEPIDDTAVGIASEIPAQFLQSLKPFGFGCLKGVVDIEQFVSDEVLLRLQVKDAVEFFDQDVLGGRVHVIRHGGRL